MLELSILATIPEDLEVGRSAVFGEPVAIYSPKSPAALEFKKLATALVKEI